MYAKQRTISFVIVDSLLSRLLVPELKESAIGDLWEAHARMRKAGKNQYFARMITIWRSFLLIKASIQIYLDRPQQSQLEAADFPELQTPKVHHTTLLMALLVITAAKKSVRQSSLPTALATNTGSPALPYLPSLSVGHSGWAAAHPVHGCLLTASSARTSNQLSEESGIAGATLKDMSHLQASSIREISEVMMLSKNTASDESLRQMTIRLAEVKAELQEMKQQSQIIQAQNQQLERRLRHFFKDLVVSMLPSAVRRVASRSTYKLAEAATEQDVLRHDSFGAEGPH